MEYCHVIRIENSGRLEFVILVMSVEKSRPLNIYFGTVDMLDHCGKIVESVIDISD